MPRRTGSALSLGALHHCYHRGRPCSTQCAASALCCLCVVDAGTLPAALVLCMHSTTPSPLVLGACRDAARCAPVLHMQYNAIIGQDVVPGAANVSYTPFEVKASASTAWP